jgi:hypothetical protein
VLKFSLEPFFDQSKDQVKENYLEVNEEKGSISISMIRIGIAENCPVVPKKGKAFAVLLSEVKK